MTATAEVRTETTTTAPPQTLSRPRNLFGATKLRTGHSLFWWVEIGCILGFYSLYSFVRNSVDTSAAIARSNAFDIVRFEQWIGIYHEQTLNAWAASTKWFAVACNYFYGTFHFWVTPAVGVYLFRKRPTEYARWRNTLAITTALALVGFWTYQLMPPRLLPADYKFVDTVANFGTPWNWKSSAVNKFSNPYAAMPSLHCAWAMWCAIALVPHLKRRISKAIMIAYPALTVAVVAFTGNHYFVDAIGGYVVLFIGWILAKKFTRSGRTERASGALRSLA